MFSFPAFDIVQGDLNLMQLRHFFKFIFSKFFFSAFDTFRAENKFFHFFFFLFYVSFFFNERKKK